VPVAITFSQEGFLAFPAWQLDWRLNVVALYVVKQIGLTSIDLRALAALESCWRLRLRGRLQGLLGNSKGYIWCCDAVEILI
jgi:hypothetical protein